MVALITGASSGIGEALAKECAERGFDVVLCARRRERLDELSLSLAALGRRSLVVVCDVTKRADLDAAVTEAEKTFGQLNMVFANAGFGISGTIESLTLADYERQFATNIYGVLHTYHASLPALKKSQGRFIAVGSVNGYIALPGGSAYAMSKFAVRAFCESARVECRPDGVSVTHIAPGFVTSEIRKIDNHGRFHPRAKEPIPSWLPMPAATAARKIVSAALKRKKEVVITGHGKILVFIMRHWPWAMQWLLSGMKVRARREAASQ